MLPTAVPATPPSSLSNHSNNNNNNNNNSSSKSSKISTNKSDEKQQKQERRQTKKKRQAFLYPGFGTRDDCVRLAAELSTAGSPVSLETVIEIMKRRGRSTTRVDDEEEAEAPTAANNNNNNNLWGDFMAEQGVTETTVAATSVAAPTKQQQQQQPGLLVQTGCLDTRRRTTTTDLWVPTVLSLPVQVTTVATSCAAAHCLAITSTGSVYGWGRNEAGQVLPCVDDDGTPEFIAFPTPLVDLDATIVTAAVGYAHSLFVSDDNVIYTAGDNATGCTGVVGAQKKKKKKKKQKTLYPVALFDEGPISCVACGYDFSILVSNQQLYTTGCSQFGQLANGETGEYFVSANKLAYANCDRFTVRTTFRDADPSVVLDSSTIQIQSVAAGRHHAVAVSVTGQVFTWGRGHYGCLGHGEQTDAYFPRRLSNMHAQVVAAGVTSTLVRNPAGMLYYCGKHGRASEATMRPKAMELPAVVQMACGGQTVSVVADETAVYAWGVGTYGELGLGTLQKSSSQPVEVAGWKGCTVTNLAAGIGHTVAVVTDNAAARTLPVVTKKQMETKK